MPNILQSYSDAMASESAGAISATATTSGGAKVETNQQNGGVEKSQIAGDPAGTTTTPPTSNGNTFQIDVGDKNASAGDITILGVNYTPANQEITVDIKDWVNGIEIFENIFSPFISARLLVHDNYGWIDALPMSAFDKVEILLKSPTTDGIILTFIVNKISGRITKTQGEVKYNLELISYESYIAAAKTTAKTYKGNYQDIATTMFNDQFAQTGKTLEADPCANEGLIFVPFWNIFKAYSYISKKAMPVSGSGIPSFFFFETTKGFKFKSVEGFFQNPDVQTFVQTNAEYHNTEYGQGNKYETDMKLAFEVAIPETSNGLELINAGAFGAKLWVKDTMEADVWQNEYTYAEWREKVQQYFGGDDGYKPNFDAWGDTLEGSAAYRAYTQTSYIYDEYEDILQYKEWELFRNVFIEELLHFSVKIRVYGTMHYNVGDMVSLTIWDSSNKIGSLTPKVLERYSGRYFISAIKHSITPIDSKHVCTLQLSRNFFGMSPPTGASVVNKEENKEQTNDKKSNVGISSDKPETTTPTPPKTSSK